MTRVTTLIASLAIITGCNTKSLSELCESACEQSTDYGAECLGLTGADDTGGGVSTPPIGTPEQFYDNDACTASCNEVADDATEAGCKDQMRDVLTCADELNWDDRECSEIFSPYCEAEQAALHHMP